MFCCTVYSTSVQISEPIRLRQFMCTETVFNVLYVFRIVVGTMSSSDRALQESKFEILTSEVSYLKSLNILITLFVESLELAAALQPEERAALFSNILEGKHIFFCIIYNIYY